MFSYLVKLKVDTIMSVGCMQVVRYDFSTYFSLRNSIISVTFLCHMEGLGMSGSKIFLQKQCMKVDVGFFVIWGP